MCGSWNVTSAPEELNFNILTGFNFNNMSSGYFIAQYISKMLFLRKHIVEWDLLVELALEQVHIVCPTSLSCGGICVSGDM